MYCVNLFVNMLMQLNEVFPFLRCGNNVGLLSIGEVRCSDIEAVQSNIEYHYLILVSASSPQSYRYRQSITAQPPRFSVLLRS